MASIHRGSKTIAGTPWLHARCDPDLRLNRSNTWWRDPSLRMIQCDLKLRSEFCIVALHQDAAVGFCHNFIQAHTLKLLKTRTRAVQIQDTLNHHFAVPTGHASTNNARELWTWSSQLHRTEFYCSSGNGSIVLLMTMINDYDTNNAKNCCCADT